MLLNPDTDIEVTRHLTGSPDLVWRCWSEPELFAKWYAPKPWIIDEVVQDLRPGGRFFMVMAGPDGVRMPNEGSFLQVVPARRLVFTDLMTAGYAPVAAVSADFGPAFTAVITLTPEGTGTRYHTVARHGSAADATANRDMGFADGCGMTSAQLDDVSKGLMS